MKSKLSLTSLMLVLYTLHCSAHIMDADFVRKSNKDAIDSYHDQIKQLNEAGDVKKVNINKVTEQKQMEEERKLEKKYFKNMSAEKQHSVVREKREAEKRADKKIVEELKRIENKYKFKSTPEFSTELKFFRKENKNFVKSSDTIEKAFTKKMEKYRIQKKNMKTKSQIKHADASMKMGNNAEQRHALKKLRLRQKREAKKENLSSPVQTKGFVAKKQAKYSGLDVDPRDIPVLDENYIDYDNDMNDVYINNYVHEVPSIRDYVYEIPPIENYDIIDHLLSLEDIASNTIEPPIEDITTAESVISNTESVIPTTESAIVTTENVVQTTEDAGQSVEIDLSTTEDAEDFILTTEEVVPAPLAVVISTEDITIPSPTNSTIIEITDAVVPPTTTIVDTTWPWNLPVPGAEECGRARFGRQARANRGARMMKILSGKEALPGSFPWQVAILDSDRDLLCGGSLIAPRWVMTAAHCVRKKLYVRLSEHHILEKDGLEVEQKVRRIYKHPGFNTSTIDNDIALLRLPALPAYRDPRTGLTTRGVSDRACLPANDQEMPPVGTRCLVMGWGKASMSNSFGTDVLMYTRLPVISQKACVRANRKTITENMFCAGHYKGGSDTCSGDSGGPLLCSVNNQPGQEIWTVYGVTSFGDGCGNAGKMGVYAKVNNYLDWISDIMSKYI